MMFGLERDAQIEEQYDAQRFTPEQADLSFNCWSKFIDIPGFDEKAQKIRQFQTQQEKEYGAFIGRHYYGME